MQDHGRRWHDLTGGIREPERHDDLGRCGACLRRLTLRAGGAKPGENRVVTCNRESALLLRDVFRKQGDRNFNVGEDAAPRAVDVIVALGALVEPARLVGERQLLDELMLGKQMECAIHRAVGDRRITPPDPLEDLSRGEVPFGGLDLREDDRALGRIAIRSTDSLGNHAVLLAPVL